MFWRADCENPPTLERMVLETRPVVTCCCAVSARDSDF